MPTKDTQKCGGEISPQATDEEETLERVLWR